MPIFDKIFLICRQRIYCDEVEKKKKLLKGNREKKETQRKKKCNVENDEKSRRLN